MLKQRLLSRSALLLGLSVTCSSAVANLNDWLQVAELPPSVMQLVASYSSSLSGSGAWLMQDQALSVAVCIDHTTESASVQQAVRQKAEMCAKDALLNNPLEPVQPEEKTILGRSGFFDDRVIAVAWIGASILP